MWFHVNLVGDSAASLELVEDFKTKVNSMLEEYKKYTLEKDIYPKFMLELVILQIWL